MLWNTSPHLVDTLHPSHLCRTFIILLSWWQIIDKDYPSRPHALLPSPCPPRSIDLLSSSRDTMSNVTIVGPKGEIKTSDLNDLIVKSINSQAFIGAFTSLIAAANPPPFNSSSKVTSNHQSSPTQNRNNKLHIQNIGKQRIKFSVPKRN